MTAYTALWAAFVIATGIIAWFGNKRTAIAFVVVAMFSAAIPALTLGHPSPRLPDGEYVVLGFKIDEPVAIYVLLDSVKGEEPRYYSLPYSKGAAKALQDSRYAADAVMGQVVVSIGKNAAPGFSERPPEELAPKVPDVPLIDGELPND